MGSEMCIRDSALAARRVAASGAHEVTDAEANAGMVVDAADDGAADAADADADTDAPTSAVAAAWPIELVNVHAGRAVPQRRLNARAGGGGAHASPSPLPSPSPPPPPPALWSAIDASSGQIHIAVRARNSSWTPSRGTSTAWPPLWPNDAAQYYAPVDRFSGIQIHQADAKMLQKQVRTAAAAAPPGKPRSDALRVRRWVRPRSVSRDACQRRRALER